MNVKLLFIILSALFLISCNNSTDPDNGLDEFGFYLLKDTLLTIADVKDISIDKLQLQEKPIINLNDIIDYNWEEQVITLTLKANEEFKKFDTKQISVFGMPFVVVAEGTKIYVGNIYPMYSSILQTDFPMIEVTPFTGLRIFKSTTDTLNDKRRASRIYRVLKKHNKIK